MWQVPVGIGVGLLYSGQSPRRAVTATGLTLVGSAIVRSIGWRTAGATAWFAIRAVGAMTIQGFASAVVGGALVGTGISYVLFGKEGAKAAVDFYTDPLDIEKGKTIANIPSNIAGIMRANQAVANNAAGVPAGTRMTDAFLPGGRGNPAHSQYQEPGIVTRYREHYEAGGRVGY